MKRSLFLLLILFLCSCRSLPEIKHFDAKLPLFDSNQCLTPFPEGKWQFIHSIEATMPNQRKAVVMGITNISSEKREIKVIMMTIEGLVLFDAEYKNELKVNKGVSPFDSKVFAIGLMDDIKLIFFKPTGNLEQSGCFGNGSHVCRYRNDVGIVIDINFIKDNVWEIIKYNNHNKIDRVIHIDLYNQKTGKDGIPQTIELTAYGKHRYSLTLDLIETKKISD